MKRFIILTTLMLWVVLGSFALYYVNRPVANVSAARPAYSLASDAFYNQFEENEDAANQKYLGKVVELSGTVKEIATDENGQLSVILKGDDFFGVSCKLNSETGDTLKNIRAGDAVTIKGICSGKLMDVVLVNCSLEKS